MKNKIKKNLINFLISDHYEILIQQKKNMIFKIFYQNFS